MRVMVTGGAGFIGSHLVEALVDKGHRVIVYDNLTTGTLVNLISVMPYIDLRRGDVRDPAELTAALADVEVVFHLAALGSVPRSIEEPLSTHEVNVNGTFNVLLAAKNAGVSRVVYSASSSSYGETEGFRKVESMPPQPLSPYAAGKLSGEAYMSAFSRCYGIETVSLRYFNVFGPRQVSGSKYSAVIPRFMRALLCGSRPVIYGDGSQTRDFTYVSNVVTANMLALAARQLSGETVNIACGARTSLNTLLAKIANLLEVQCRAEYHPAVKGDVHDSQADLQQARKLLGYAPQIGLDEGLVYTAEWFKKNLYECVMKT